MKGSILNSEIVEPYAEALMSIAEENNQRDALGDEIRNLLSLLAESQELREFLGNPVIEAEDKKGVLRQILGQDSNPSLRKFLMLVVDRGRIILLEDICEQYLSILRDLNQTVLAEVTSTTELSEDQKSIVIEKVKQITAAQSVELQTNIDPDLIGGVIIKVGSQIFDASLRGQLRRISLQLSGSA